MRYSTILSIAVFTVIAFTGYSQADSTKAKSDTAKHPNLPLPSVMGGIGVLYFNGDIGKGAGITAYSTVRAGFTFGVEERPIPYFGVELSGLIGKLGASERSDNPSDNLNFQSNIFQGDLLLNLHLDGLLLKKDAVIAPFIYTGFSFMSFKTFTDSLDKYNSPYYYWTDGSIRDQPQNSADILTSHIIQRDYTYETALNSGTTFSVPVGIGAKIRITDNILCNIQAAYYLTFSKEIEHYSLTNKNNKYLYSFFTIEYNLNKKPSEGPPVDESRYQGVDFSENFIKDTIKQSKISHEQEQALENAAAHADTSAVDRSTLFNNNPTLEFAKGLDEQHQAAAEQGKTPGHKVPARFAAADKNHDGYISSQEITQVIDEFFDGTSTFTIADINALIDYFFDQ